MPSKSLSRKTQVLDHEADFGGLTGWCRAVVDTKCSPIDQQVILTPSLHQTQILTIYQCFLMLLNVLETKLIFRCLYKFCALSQSFNALETKLIFQDEIDRSLLISDRNTVVEVKIPRLDRRPVGTNGPLDL